MSNLSPESRALLSAAKGVLRPGRENRERVSAALRAKLGDGVLPAVLTHQTASAFPHAAHGSLWKVVFAVAAGASMVGAIAYFGVGQRRQSLPVRSVPIAAVAVPAPSSNVLSPTVAPTASTAPPLEKPSADSPRASTRRPDRLAQEVAILSRATRDLRSGRAAEALKALGEHERRFPGGLLTEERRAAKAQALCVLGRFTDADAELSLLSPQSPNAARARQVCANRAARSH